LESFDFVSSFCGWGIFLQDFPFSQTFPLWVVLLADGLDPSLVSPSYWLELPLWEVLQPENLTFESELLVGRDLRIAFSFSSN